jgi:hypothetical protein
VTGVAVLVVDRLGRRPLLIGGVSGIVSVLSCRLSKTDHRQSIWHFDIIHFLLEMLPSANVTEFLGCFIIFAVLLHFTEGCILCGCDSTSTVCWLLPGTLIAHCIPYLRILMCCALGFVK